ILQLQEGEEIRSILPTRDYKDFSYIIFATQNGIVKRTPLDAYNTSLKDTGIKAMTLKEGDKLIAVKAAEEDQQIMLMASNGRANRFGISEIKSTGRLSSGVRAINLKEGAKVIGMSIAEELKYLLTITSEGYGKRTKLSEFS